MISPTSLRIAASGVCQLQCPLCQTHSNPLPAGTGKLRSADFKHLIDRNPQFRKVEFGGKGEVFLNENLPEMLRYAYKKNVITSIGAGTNLNFVSDEALESLVLYQTERVRCAIDGVTQETYQQYRVGGDLHAVLHNIERINAFKERYRSSKPHLIFQFVLFGHNHHEIERATLLAKMLKMDFVVRLNYSSDTFTLSAPKWEAAKKFIGYTSREDYLEKEGRSYLRSTCYHLWREPQIRWDGEILGCACNNFGTFSGNVFKDGYVPCVNSEKMAYARDMHMGRKPSREDIPCAQCETYKNIVRFGNWIAEDEILNTPEQGTRPEGK